MKGRKEEKRRNKGTKDGRKELKKVGRRMEGKKEGRK